MSYRHGAIAAAALSLAMLAPSGFASAADLPVKAKPKPVADLPFFFVIDGTTAKSVYSFTHFDAWQYGTNFFTISMYKSDHNDPANPCINAGVLFNGNPEVCAGATEFYGLTRNTFDWNSI